MISQRPAVVTFDCYSALVDSHAGLTLAFEELGQQRSWQCDADELAAYFDQRNKSLQRDTTVYAPFAELARRAMAATLEQFELEGDASADTAAVLGTMPRWPHYPDVPDGVGAVASRYPVALLTNIDDHLLARTRPGFAFPRAITSEQARCFKPHPGLYRHAEARLGTPLLHVAASARDVRGALEAGIDVIRVARPGHHVDPGGPLPSVTVVDLRELEGLLP